MTYSISQMFADIEVLGDNFEDLKGYEGRYRIHKSGKSEVVYKITKSSIWRVPIEEVGQRLKYIRLTKDGKSKRFPLHHIIALQFLPNPNNLSVVVHIVKSGLDNYNTIDNLMWCPEKTSYSDTLSDFDSDDEEK